MNTLIKESAQNILWECQRQERLVDNLRKLRVGKKFQRMDIVGVSRGNDVYLRLEDLTKESREVILECIKSQIIKCKD